MAIRQGVWFREEIERVVLTIEDTMVEMIRTMAGEDDPYLRGYRDGVRAVLKILCNAFEIERE
ncbi:MAG: hypothetical protein QW687_03445 [Candidatus Hadarchaeales archaeon]